MKGSIGSRIQRLEQRLHMASWGSVSDELLGEYVDVYLRLVAHCAVERPTSECDRKRESLPPISVTNGAFSHLSDDELDHKLMAQTVRVLRADAAENSEHRQLLDMLQDAGIVDDERPAVGDFYSPKLCAKWRFQVEQSDLPPDVRVRAAELLRLRTMNCSLDRNEANWLHGVLEESGLDLGRDGQQPWLREHLEDGVGPYEPTTVLATS